MARRRWQDLSPNTRRLILIGASVDGVLRMAALRDLRHRPAEQVRGRKWVWGLTLGLVSSAGTLPLAYFLRGRRPAG
ncbi:hypothetical protein [Nocardioides panaciterrulae]|uniref:DUF2834 domain-containing protein n=1 Tax=Nocardioides panaciterrulae TaxID=661492 RepID=A0A7Y9E8J8_9ACTN|nr:hypothetical protein [Nocardioides panaciterrulae]NYD42890.1 hypothetical protein [Nocardioides panaciterrulae]